MIGTTIVLNHPVVGTVSALVTGVIVGPNSSKVLVSIEGDSPMVLPDEVIDFKLNKGSLQ